ARDEVTRLQSEDVARERLLERTSLEKRLAELGAEQTTTAATLERIEAARAASARMQALEKESKQLAKSAKEAGERQKEAAKAVRSADEEEAGVKSVAQVIRWRAAREALAKAESGLSQVNAWRDEAGRKRAAAAAVEAELGGLRLPSPALLAD